jgi:GNAT superfamily N-acetyltransferase
MKQFKKIKIKILHYFYFIKGWVLITKLPKTPSVTIDDITFKGYLPCNENGMKNIYLKLNNSKLTRSQLRLYNRLGNRIMIIASRSGQDGCIQEIAMNMFYLNPRDFKESTIHEGFIGVLPEFEGKGIASQMRKVAINHFKQAGFAGISSRISKSNLASLRSAKKLGFKPVEEYFDDVMNEERYYLVCNLQNK